jgi:asparagine synthase (glutamine-hydrolysing)
MCGIFALFLNRPLRETDLVLARAGTRALAHRGPDGSGEWIDKEKGIFLGHRRLSIIDLSPSGNQPLTRDGQVIAYNGEIYNHAEVRNELKKLGYEFTSRSDTEVLLRAWQHWGPGCLDRVDGMFAFVLYDGTSIHAAVDPFGEKPLFYADLDDGFCFSSELAPLVELFSPRPRLSAEITAAYFCLGNIPAPETAFDRVWRMPAASRMTFRHSGRDGPIQYWEAPVAEARGGRVQPISESEVDELEEVLTESLRRRLYADVPMTLFLSAGVDSSLVAALARHHLNANIECLTVSFPAGKVNDEAEGAKAIARELGLDHRTVVSEGNSTAVSPESLIDLFGQPVANPSTFSVLQLAKVAAKTHKLAMSGMGGDELTAGYNKHHDVYVRRRWFALPEAARLVAGSACRLVENEVERAGSIRRYSLNADRELYVAVKNLPAIDWLREVPGFHAWTSGEFGTLRSPAYREFVAYELRRVISNEHLPSYDHATMRAGLELRTPFLSRDVADVVSRMDLRALLAFGQKHLLRRILSRHIPDRFQSSRKMGFRYPLDRFISTQDNAVPTTSLLPKLLAEKAWAKRFDHAGWSRIAVRLLVASAFEKRFDVLHSAA